MSTTSVSESNISPVRRLENVRDKARKNGRGTSSGRISSNGRNVVNGKAEAATGDTAHSTATHTGNGAVPALAPPREYIDKPQLKNVDFSFEACYRTLLDVENNLNTTAAARNKMLRAQGDVDPIAYMMGHPTLGKEQEYQLLYLGLSYIKSNGNHPDHPFDFLLCEGGKRVMEALVRSNIGLLVTVISVKVRARRSDEKFDQFFGQLMAKMPRFIAKFNMKKGYRLSTYIWNCSIRKIFKIKGREGKARFGITPIQGKDQLEIFNAINIFISRFHQRCKAVVTPDIDEIIEGIEGKHRKNTVRLVWKKMNTNQNISLHEEAGAKGHKNKNSDNKVVHTLSSKARTPFTAGLVSDDRMKRRLHDAGFESLSDLLAHLNPLHAEIIRMKFVEQKTQVKIAAEISAKGNHQVSPGCVRERIRESFEAIHYILDHPSPTPDKNWPRRAMSALRDNSPLCINGHDPGDQVLKMPFAERLRLRPVVKANCCKAKANGRS